jgi:uncharacterized OB-fold protein
MDTGFEAGAVYVPRFAEEGRALPAPDEDPFTMAVSALERLATPTGASRPTRVHLVGDFPPAVDWALPAYLAGPVELVRHDGDAGGLSSAVRSAMEGLGAATSALVIAFDRTGPQGAQAVALRFGPKPVGVTLAWDGEPGDGAAALARAALVRAGIEPDPVPGTRAPPATWSLDAASAFGSTELGRVSEGAYVPRPRYLESLPSRWRLEGDRCGACGKVTFPRRGRCRHCGAGEGLAQFPLPRDGARVVAATVIGKGGQPTEFDPQVDALGPYGVVLAEFEPGVRLTLQVTDAAPGDVRIGDRIGTRLRRLYPMEGEWRYGRKAVPLSP